MVVAALLRVDLLRLQSRHPHHPPVCRRHPPDSGLALRTALYLHQGNRCSALVPTASNSRLQITRGNWSNRQLWLAPSPRPAILSIACGPFGGELSSVCSPHITSISALHRQVKADSQDPRQLLFASAQWITRSLHEGSTCLRASTFRTTCDYIDQ